MVSDHWGQPGPGVSFSGTVEPKDWSLRLWTNIRSRARRSCRPGDRARRAAVCAEHRRQPGGRPVGDYLTCGTSSLVAFGFFATARHGLAPVLATVLPALVILGLFTFVRLVEAALVKRGPPAAHRGHPPLLLHAEPGRRRALSLARESALGLRVRGPPQLPDRTATIARFGKRTAARCIWY